MDWQGLPMGNYHCGRRHVRQRAGPPPNADHLLRTERQLSDVILIPMPLSF